MVWQTYSSSHRQHGSGGSVGKRFFKEPSGIVMHLLCCLSFVSAIFQFTYSAFHIPGAWNSLMNDISRNQLSSLPHRKSRFPQIFGLFLCETGQTGPCQSGDGFSQISCTRYTSNSKELFTSQTWLAAKLDRRMWLDWNLCTRVLYSQVHIA